MTHPNSAAAMQTAKLTDEEIRRIADKTGAQCEGWDGEQWDMALSRAIEQALLSKLRAPVADERISLSGAANLAFNALHECKPVKGAEKQYSDAIQALQSALHDIAYTVNRTATPQQFADHLQSEARAALASAPVAGEAQISDDDALDILSEYGDHNVEHGRIMFDKWTLQAAGEALLQRYRAGKDGEHGE